MHGFEVFAGRPLSFDPAVLQDITAVLSTAVDGVQRSEHALGSFSGALSAEWAELERDAWTRRQTLGDTGALAQDYPTPHQIEWMHALRREVEDLKGRAVKMAERVQRTAEIVHRAIDEYNKADSTVSEAWGRVDPANPTFLWSAPIARPRTCEAESWVSKAPAGLSMPQTWAHNPGLRPQDVEPVVRVVVYGAAAGLVGGLSRKTKAIFPREPDFQPAAQILSAVEPQILKNPADLFTSFSSLYMGPAKDKVQVTKMTEPNGDVRWAVLIPGTQEWLVNGLDSTMHLDSAVDTMVGYESDGLKAVDAALQAAGVSPEDPVVLFGHSQGGIIASAIASKPRYRGRYNVKAVVTAESPQTIYGTPAGVTTLNIENTKDVVPRLDLRDTTGNWNHVTVSGNVQLSDGDDPHDVEVAADVYAKANQNSVKVQEISSEIGKHLWRPGMKVETTLYETPFVEKPFGKRVFQAIVS